MNEINRDTLPTLMGNLMTELKTFLTAYKMITPIAYLNIQEATKKANTQLGREFGTARAELYEEFYSEYADSFDDFAPYKKAFGGALKLLALH